MAIDGYMVNGTSFVYVGTGSAGALELLGYTVEGADMNVEEHKGEIFTDLFGPRTPQDFQDFGMTARIIAPFIAVDRTVLAKIMSRGDHTGAPANQGTLNTPGLVLGVGGYGFRVGIASTFDSPWSFNTCILRPGYGTRLATKANPFRVEFMAWPYASYTATTGKNVPLFTRSLT